MLAEFDAAQNLLNMLRHEPYGERIPVALDEQDPGLRDALLEDVRIARAEPTVEDAAKALCRNRLGAARLATMRPAAQAWWGDRAAAARGEVLYDQPPYRSGEEDRRVGKPDGNAICRRCRRPMRRPKPGCRAMSMATACMTVLRPSGPRPRRPRMSIQAVLPSSARRMRGVMRYSPPSRTARSTVSRMDSRSSGCTASSQPNSFHSS